MSAEAGVELYPIAEQIADQATLAEAGFRACAAYNYAGVNVPAGQKDAPYDTMVTGYEDMWKQATKDAKLPYIVPVSPGWDSRPWKETAFFWSDNTPEKFIAAVEEINPDIVALSALLSVTMLSMKDIISSLAKAGFRKRVKVMVGGAPLSESYAAEIGADGYARDAGGAVELARSLMLNGGR